jgi:beta-glucanase (GH16 family)
MLNLSTPFFTPALCLFLVLNSHAQGINPFQPDASSPQNIKGMTLVWNDEFNANGLPNPGSWNFENGFVRNEELQWYQPDNAVCKDGVLLIEARKEQVKNPLFDPKSNEWRQKREYADITSSSLTTRGLYEFRFGRVEVRARIDTTLGSWPAIWLLGREGQWPSNGEIDMLEFYRKDNKAILLANVAWGTDKQYVAKWDTGIKPLSDFLSNDQHWVEKFHTWRMDWDENSINLYLDDVLFNSTSLSETINADRSNPFVNPAYLLLNLAVGSNGGDPSTSTFPITYEVDYVRVYQKAD